MGTPDSDSSPAHTGPASDGLPGGDLVLRGLADLDARIVSPEALLVSIGAPRLRALGYEVRDPYGSAEHRLYELLSARHGDAAHARYNALVRRLVSFERAATADATRQDA